MKLCLVVHYHLLKTMCALKRYFIPISKAGPKIICNYCCKMKKFSRRPDKYPLQIRYDNARTLALKVSKDLLVEINVEGLENIPHDRVSCYVGNHLGDFDPFLLFAALNEPFTFVAKKETRKFPFVGTFLKSISGEFMDRKDLRQSLKVMNRVEEDLRQGNKNWVIFPEGTRNKDPQKLCLDFHHGTFRAPMRAGVPIIPFVLIGTQRIFKTKPVYKKYPVFIKLLKPIFPEGYQNMTSQEVALEVKSRIQKTLSFEMRTKDLIEMKRLNPKYNPF